MKPLRVALAGNANVGKSVLFNRLTGLNQHIGNWPGKTVEKAEGVMDFRGRRIEIVDLPGIYSLSTFSIEELVSREHIAMEKPDVVINVLDASVLERNLFFTYQLLELGRPIVIALNMVDIARRRGVLVDEAKLSRALGVPVVSIVANKGIGIATLMEEAIRVARKRQSPRPVAYRRPLEERISALAAMVDPIGSGYPSRWIAIKLLEGDRQVAAMVEDAAPGAIKAVSSHLREIRERNGQDGHTVISAERYSAAERTALECTAFSKPDVPLTQKLDEILLHRYLGYIILITVAASLFYILFTLGDFLSAILLAFLSDAKVLLMPAFGEGALRTVLADGVLEGLIAGISIALPYLVPFYIMLALLEDSGYLARMAFLMDAFMQRMGLHGKAFIPLLLAYGCNVPACLSCKILETQRSRLLSTFVVTLVPCAAVTVVVMGLVAAFVGLEWALGLYLLNLAVIFILGRLAFKALPGEPVGLIMEMPSYKMPTMKSVALAAWMKIRGFMINAVPIIVATTFLIKLMEVLGLLGAVSELLSPVTVGWLGLPSAVGITLIFGALRKELALVMLAALLGTEAFDTVLSPVQMITFAVVTMFYVPCVATVAVIKKEHGWKTALAISFFEIAFALMLAGLISRSLHAFFF
ncbi:MAG: ferrous iron transport protein B [Candidatus Micrarchaeota archaeon]